MQEFQLIEKKFLPLTNLNKAASSLKDDAAKISLKQNEELVISKDMFVEDVHFLLSDDGFKIASKLLRTNLSDLAASGATPLYYMLGFSKNENTNLKFINDFTRGLNSVQKEFDLSLIGGDTVSVAKKLFFSITIFGSVEKGKILSRQQAEEGDLIFTSGTIGDAFLGRTTQANSYLINRHFFPSPRINLGKYLLKNNLSKCAADISDGLLIDLNNICRASNLRAEIFLDKIPFSQQANKILQKNSIIKALDLISAGDDYELIFCAKAKNKQKILDLSKSLGINITHIGEMKKLPNTINKKDPLVTLFNEKEQKINFIKLGYEH